MLRTVGRKKAAGFTLEQWRYVFTNTFTEEESRALYERYHIPASVRVLWGSALARSRGRTRRAERSRQPQDDFWAPRGVPAWRW